MGGSTKPPVSPLLMGKLGGSGMLMPYCGVVQSHQTPLNLLKTEIAMCGGLVQGSSTVLNLLSLHRYWRKKVSMSYRLQK